MVSGCFCVEKIYDRVYSELFRERFPGRNIYERRFDMTMRSMPTSTDHAFDYFDGQLHDQLCFKIVEITN